MDEITRDDPLSGYASCPDRYYAHLAYSRENQRKWMQKSEAIIREFIEKIDSFTDFQQAYGFLAAKRKEVANELRQKADEGKTENYGTFRKEDDHFRQNVSVGDGEHFWKWQKKMIFMLARELIHAFKQAAEKAGKKYNIEDEHKICLLENVTVERMPATYYSLTIKFPNVSEISPDPHAETLSTIELYEFPDDPASDLIRIEYAAVNNQYIEQHYRIANHYYQQLLNWRSGEKLAVFMEAAARLFYLMAHLLLVKQGNCAVMEWMLRAIAFRNGIDLGQFNFASGISWDFKAILTPNVQDYVHWFAKDLFVQVRQFDPKEQGLFTFARQSSK